MAIIGIIVKYILMACCIIGGLAYIKMTSLIWDSLLMTVFMPWPIFLSRFAD